MRQVAHRIEHARESVRRQGIDPERMPWDYEKLIAELRPGAEKAVRRALLLEAIADKETITPTDADVDAEVEKMAQASQRPTPAVRRLMEKSGDLEGMRQGLRDRISYRPEALPGGGRSGQGHQPLHQLAGRLGDRGHGHLRHDAVREAGDL